jgi:uncharacterized repeat protein (TIGR03803 family)
VYAVDPATGAETVLHSFGSSSDGQFPYSGLININGTLYGTTALGGARGVGVVFSVNPMNGAEAVVHSFGKGGDGRYPSASLINVKGTLYGTTSAGGIYGGGSVFSVNPQTGSETVLHSFGNGTDGQSPLASLLDVNGTLYGTTWDGGIYGYGIVFSLNRKTGAESVLYSFGNGADGQSPSGALINLSGTFYGTTSAGGSYGEGTVFSITP